MKKFLMSGVLSLILLGVFFSSFLINNTVSDQKNFNPKNILSKKNEAASEKLVKSDAFHLIAQNDQQRLSEQSHQQNPQKIFETDSLWNKTLGELTTQLLDTIDNNENNPSIMKIARIRKQKLEQLIRTNPEMAITWGIKTDVRERLPDNIKPFIERQIHSIAMTSMFAAGGDQPHQENLRTLMVKGQTFHAFVYGNRLTQAVFDHEPINGLALGNLMAVADDTIQSEQTMEIQEPKEAQIIHTFYFQQGEVSFDRAENFDIVRLMDSIPGESTPGSPLLPTRLVSIEIPAGASLIKISAKGDESIFKAGLDIFPMQPQTPTSQNDALEFVPPDPEIYERQDKFPLSVAIHDDTQRVRGKTYVTIRLNPLRYIPKEKELYFSSSIKVTIDYRSPSIPPSRTESDNEHVFDAPLGVPLDNNDQNFEGAEIIDNDISKLNVPRMTIQPNESIDYLIITKSEMTESFQALAKHRQNYNSYATKILTIDDINNQYDGTRPDGKTDLQTKIRNAIADHVQNYGVTYVVLGGDNSIVPDRDTYVSVGGYIERSMPTDLYYAGLDGTWDEWDNDGTYGESRADGNFYHNEGDLSADVLLGRIPIRSATQAKAYIDKVIAYETAPHSDILKKMLIGGMKLWNKYSGNNRPDEIMNDTFMQFCDDNHTYTSDAEIWGRRMYRDSVKNYWQGNQLSYIFDTLTSWDYNSAGSYASSSSHMVDKFNEGWNFMTYSTHGNKNIWATESGHFKDSHAMNLNNLTAFVYTIACITGAFDKERSLSEGFLRNPNGGAIVYMGCSRYGWGSPRSYHGGTSLVFQRKFYEKVFKEKIINVGEAFNAHKAAYSPSSSYNGSYRWVQFGMNLQGDPAINIKGIEDNKAPDANDQEIVINMDTPTQIILDASDPDGEFLTFTCLTLPEHGSFDEPFGKSMRYTPEIGYVGNDSFTYQASDGEKLSRVATVFIKVQLKDTIPPTQPQNLVAQTNGEGQILLQWTSSDDDNAVSGYFIFRDNVIIDETLQASYRDINLDPKTVYEYKVQAFDSVGNVSIMSEMIEVETIPEQFPPDGNIPENWVKVGDAGWKVCKTVSSNGKVSSTGKYSLQAETINDMQTAGIQFMANFAEGVIEFDLRVSCESRFDGLSFFIDNEEMDNWSGEQSLWNTVKYPISKGIHTISWVYAKDYSGLSGEDSAWIDNVILPETSQPYGTLTLEIQGLGSTLPLPGIHDVLLNQKIPIAAFPDPGYTFEKWIATSTAVIANPKSTTTTVMMSDNSVITAQFVRQNQPPRFEKKYYSLEPVTEDSNFTLDLNSYASDPDLIDSLLFEKVSGPQWLIISSDGIMGGTPSNEDVGTNTFVIRVLDNMKTMDEAIFEIVVDNVNDAPAFRSQTLIGDPAIVNESYLFTIADMATDPDKNDSLIFTKEKGPEWLTLNDDGIIRGTPSEAGAHQFEVKVMDNAGAFDFAWLLITVKEYQQNDYEPGITVAYYDYQSKLASLPDFKQPPDLVRIESDVNYQKSRYEWLDLDRKFKDTYASIHDGHIYIEKSGEYTFFLKSDDGSRLWINGTLIIENDGLHGMREKSGTVLLEPGYHHFRIHFFENYGYTGLILSYEGPEIKKQVVPSEVLFHSTVNMQPIIHSNRLDIFDCQTQGAVIGKMIASDPNLNDQLSYTIIYSTVDNAIEIDSKTGNLIVNNPELIKQNFDKTLELTIQVSDNGNPILTDTATAWITIIALEDYRPGLHAEFFDFNQKISRLPDLKDAIPDLVRTDSQLNYASIRKAWVGLSNDFKDTFASRHTGYIYITTTGKYTFYLKSDDGSKLLLNNNLLIDNDGLHGMREKKSTLNLNKGFHPIRIEFFENRGGAGLILSYQGPNFNKCVVPASVLYQSTVNFPPELPDKKAFAVEGQEKGTIVANMTAFDLNFDDTITYKIDDGNTNSAFEIDPMNGDIRILNSQAIDKSIHTRFILQIIATDNG
ncbi:membrane or secreted protein containing PA14 domain protein, partial [Candidatus Magnetomorum sp. HK-1]